MKYLIALFVSIFLTNSALHAETNSSTVFPPANCSADQLKVMAWQDGAPTTYCVSGQDVLALALPNCSDGQHVVYHGNGRHPVAAGSAGGQYFSCETPTTLGNIPDCPAGEFLTSHNGVPTCEAPTCCNSCQTDTPPPPPSVACSAPTEHSFTSSGTWIKPAGVTWIEVTVTGAGGGGAGNRGGGGGGGATSIGWLNAVSFSSVPVTVGKGGAGDRGTENSGSSGGTSSFGSYFAAQGGAGGWAKDDVDHNDGHDDIMPPPGMGGMGGKGGAQPTSGDTRTAGGDGGPSGDAFGGSSYWGLGATPKDKASRPGVNVGSGGAAPQDQDPVKDNILGHGADGIVVVKEFYCQP